MTDVIDKFKNSARNVAFEADKIVRINKLQFEINNIKHQLDSSYRELGKIAYQQFIDQEPKTAFDEFCKKITEYQQAIKDKEKEVQGIKTEDYSFSAKQKLDHKNKSENFTIYEVLQTDPEPEPVIEKKNCPFCQNEIPNQAKFCPVCGKKL
jgi:paraquat-inducible protein B